MPYADLFVGILLIVLLVIAAVRILSPKTDPTRALFRDKKGELVAIGGRKPSAGQISGRGAQTSAPLQLAAGTYRIDYQFDALTRLGLIDTEGDETVLIKSGAGTESLTIAVTGRYHLRIEPNDEGAAWWVAYRQLNDQVSAENGLAE